ncbi:MAG: methylthioribulose 1-phosphate dehydratase [Gammaproteobacteria bacterium]|nr:methylthioribulose 1-phosphate dehydratase [Gammaproteobacteria bacterium]MCF6229843.1 methylthioribulose 1-phosphate dehydratase [Gammaproteobacteria bacterium]
MATLFDQFETRDALAKMGKIFHSRGWMAGTAGNLSARDNKQADSFWITASGKPKGALAEDDFLRLAMTNGQVIESTSSDDKPSAEVAIHQVIYRLFPEACCCLHVHTVDACIATQGCHEPSLQLPPLEMIKGMGVWLQSPEVRLPLFDNRLEVTRIATEIEQSFMQQSPDISALMIRQHGLTVWGDSLQQAYNRLEIMEFIMSYVARVQQHG